jgi:heptosyltransferase I
MQVLIVKTSSMGDVLHTLPALTDAVKAIPFIQFDWVIEPGFADIPRWHASVRNIFPAAIRHWRKHPWKSLREGEIATLISRLRRIQYDVVLDAQGLFKSALLTRLAKGKRVGLNFSSAREGIASLAYQQTIEIPKGQHAVQRVRQLFAKALEYPIPDSFPDYRIDKTRLTPSSINGDYVLFLHGTTWPTKHWPENYWQQLAALAAKAGYKVLLPWGTEEERIRAYNIRRSVESQGGAILPHVLPKLSLSEITSLIANAKGIISVDTGLGHVAAAMAIPTVSLYGSTDPKLTGAYGHAQHHLCVNYECSPCLSRDCQKKGTFSVMPPCFETLPPHKVWQTFLRHIHENLG